MLRLASGRKVEPDVMFLAHARKPTIGEQQVEGTADLVIEIVSPSTRCYDLAVQQESHDNR